MNARYFFFDFLKHCGFGFGYPVNDSMIGRVEFYPNDDYIPFSIYFGDKLVFRGSIRFTSEKSRTFYISDLYYVNPKDFLLYQPDELHKWYPAVFLRFTDVKTFLTKLFIAMRVWYSKNPRFFYLNVDSDVC